MITQDRWIRIAVSVHAHMETKWRELALTSIISIIGAWTDAWASDSSANTADIYLESLWGQTFCCAVIDGKLQLKHAPAAKKMT